MSLQALLSEYKQCSRIKQRAIAAILGVVVADAATRPFHWLYDQAKLDSIVGSNNPEFWPESKSPYYTIPTGRNSCYADLGICMLRSFAVQPSSDAVSPSSSASVSKPIPSSLFSRDAFFAQLSSLFGPDSEYALAFRARESAYDPSRRYEDRQPVPGPWQQSSITVWLNQLKSGISVPNGNPSSRETDGLVSTLPLIARLSSHASENQGNIDVTELKLLHQVESSTRVQQDHKMEAKCFPSEIDQSPDGIEFQRQIASAAVLLSSNKVALHHTLAAAIIVRALIQQGISKFISNSESSTSTPSSSSFRYLRHLAATISDSVVTEFGAPTEDDGEENNQSVTLLQEIDQIIDTVQSGLTETVAQHIEQVARWGKPCANPGSFMGALLAVFDVFNDLSLSSSSSSLSVNQVNARGFAHGIRRVIQAGGCNCSRANLAGACLGAAFGIQLSSSESAQPDQSDANHVDHDDKYSFFNSTQGIPLDWIVRTDAAVEVLELAIRYL